MKKNVILSNQVKGPISSTHTHSTKQLHRYLIVLIITMFQKDYFKMYFGCSIEFGHQHSISYCTGGQNSWNIQLDYRITSGVEISLFFHKSVRIKRIGHRLGMEWFSLYSSVKSEQPAGCCYSFYASNHTNWTTLNGINQNSEKLFPQDRWCCKTCNLFKHCNIQTVTARVSIVRFIQSVIWRI